MNNNIIYKHYLIYKTTNLINDKIYIGQHRTNDINDNYLGSGTYLLNAIDNYGKENFKKEVLFDFDNFSDMNEMETRIVTQDFIKSKSNYNQIPGGYCNSNISGMVTAKYKHDTALHGIYVTKEEFDKRDDLVGGKYGIASTNSSFKGNVACVDINDPTKKCIQVSKKEFDSNPNLLGITKGTTNKKQSEKLSGKVLCFNIADKTQQTLLVTQEEFNKRDDLVGLRSGATGNVSCFNINDPIRTCIQVSKEEFSKNPNLRGIGALTDMPKNRTAMKYFNTHLGVLDINNKFYKDKVYSNIQSKIVQSHNISFNSIYSAADFYGISVNVIAGNLKTNACITKHSSLSKIIPIGTSLKDNGWRYL